MNGIRDRAVFQKNVGILSIGQHLPQNVRTNDWWPADLVAKWKGKAAERMTRSRDTDEEAPTPGVKAVLEALTVYGADPFRGTKERRVMAQNGSAIDMIEAAARDAISRANVDAQDIDVVLGFTLCPDYLNTPDACRVHQRLGLRESVLSLEANAVCNSFQAQLKLALSLVRSGDARLVLCTQCSAIPRMELPDEPQSTWFADGATAVIIGPVGENHGALAQAHFTDGTLWGGLVAGVPGKRWFDQGKIVTYSEDREASRRMLLTVADRAKQAFDTALAKTSLTRQDITFYASHQSTAWMQSVTKNFCGLEHAKSVDIFPWAGTLSAANLPLTLSVAEREGVLNEGDVVALYSPGTGMTWSSTILRWGR